MREKSKRFNNKERNRATARGTERERDKEKVRPTKIKKRKTHQCALGKKSFPRIICGERVKSKERKRQTSHAFMLFTTERVVLTFRRIFQVNTEVPNVSYKKSYKYKFSLNFFIRN